MSSNSKILAFVTLLVALLIALWSTWSDDLARGADPSVLVRVGGIEPQRGPEPDVARTPVVAAPDAPPAAGAAGTETSPVPETREPPPDAADVAAEAPRGPSQTPSPASTAPSVPAPDSVARVFDIVLDLELEAIEVPGVGEDTVTGAAVRSELHVETHDTVPEGVDELLRRYAVIRHRWKQREGIDDLASADSSPLEGTTVRFRRDAAGGEYRATPPEGANVDPEALAYLVGDLNLSELAPPSGAAPDLRWDLAPATLGTLLRPCGNLQLGFGRSGEPAHMLPLWPMGAEDERPGFTGTLTASAGARVARDGRELLSVRLRVDARARWRDDLTDEDRARGLPVAGAESELRLEGEGEYMWDLGARRVHSLELPVDLEVRVRIDPDSSTATAIRFSGKGTWRLAVR